MNLVATAILITAAIAFVAFHLLKMVTYANPLHEPSQVERGWTVWIGILFYLKHPDLDSESMIIVSALLAATVMILSAPFLLPILSRSRVSWWVAAMCSGVALAGIGFFLTFGWDNESSRPGPGLLCLLAALILNFTGLLFIRRKTQGETSVDPV
ncbi:hypothetical protein [Luteolibacter sp. Populi]|uniref:hypothetical protein n=1 Tax=Luteolibacter sp. Populi TaxID=3230487 RepID=UPI003467DD66